MEEEKVKFETAKLAKEKLFDWEVSEGFTRHGTIFICSKRSGFFPEECRRPTQSLLQKWLREVHNIHVYSYPTFINKKWYPKAVHLDNTNDDLLAGRIFNYHRDTFEEAFELGLQEILKLIPNK